MAKKTLAPDHSEQKTKIVFCGPAGQESTVFGPLVPGQTYEAETAFAAYLVAQHPDYWTRPDA